LSAHSISAANRALVERNEKILFEFSSFAMTGWSIGGWLAGVTDANVEWVFRASRRG
jgi:hypothetical protein